MLPSQAEYVFTEFYSQWPWDENGFIFSQSSVEDTQAYTAFLQEFMAHHKIRKVIDIGCGDWSSCREVDWTGIEYVGIDLVSFVIERDQKIYGGPNIQFMQGDALTIDLPEADLLICKEVLQYMPNEDILKLLKKMTQYEHCLITAYVDPVSRSSQNQDIIYGKFHFIDLRKAPFSVQGKVVFQFPGQPRETMYIQGKLKTELDPSAPAT